VAGVDAPAGGEVSGVPLVPTTIPVVAELGNGFSAEFVKLRLLLVLALLGRLRLP
jgi:hypothetical protein